MKPRQYSARSVFGDKTGDRPSAEIGLFECDTLEYVI